YVEDTEFEARAACVEDEHVHQIPPRVWTRLVIVRSWSLCKRGIDCPMALAEPQSIAMPPEAAGIISFELASERLRHGPSNRDNNCHGNALVSGWQWPRIRS